jgi:hypothetical protein
MRGQRIAKKSKLVALKLDLALLSIAQTRTLRRTVAAVLDLDFQDVTRADVLREAVRRGMRELEKIETL